MANPNRPVTPSLPTRQTVLDPKTLRFNYDGTDANKDLPDVFTRLQRNLADQIDALLSWVNSHFVAAPAVQDSSGRSITQDDTTLIAASDQTQLVTVGSQHPTRLSGSVLQSAIPASSILSPIAFIPIGSACTVKSFSVMTAPNAPTGTLIITLDNVGSVSPTTAVKTVTSSYAATANSYLRVSATTAGNYSAAAGSYVAFSIELQ